MRRARKKLRTILLSVLTAIILLYILLPILAMVLSSIHTEGELYVSPPHWIPHNPTLMHYLAFVSERARQMLAHVPMAIRNFLLSLRNSFIVSASVTIIALVLGALLCR